MVKYVSFFFVLFCVACNNSSQNNTPQIISADVANVDGEQLFKTNCATCHKINEHFIGPMLKGVTQRWQSKELLYEFIRNSQEVSTRNDYAKKLLEEYKQYPMTAFPNLKDEEINAILKYCEAN